MEECLTAPREDGCCVAWAHSGVSSHQSNPRAVTCVAPRYRSGRAPVETISTTAAVQAATEALEQRSGESEGRSREGERKGATCSYSKMQGGGGDGEEGVEGGCEAMGEESTSRPGRAAAESEVRRASTSRWSFGEKKSAKVDSAGDEIRYV